MAIRESGGGPDSVRQPGLARPCRRHRAPVGGRALEPVQSHRTNREELIRLEGDHRREERELARWRALGSPDVDLAHVFRLALRLRNQDDEVVDGFGLRMGPGNLMEPLLSGSRCRERQEERRSECRRERARECEEEKGAAKESEEEQESDQGVFVA